MDDMTTKSSDLKISASVRIAETQDGAVLLDVKQGLCFNINPVGALIWKQLSEGCEADQICRNLADRFNISTEQACTDVQEFLQDLREKQLLQDVESTPSQSKRARGLVEVFRELWSSRKSVNHME